MIHQFIFAVPRPGWVAERFQNYWLRQHAILYAAKIRQIRQYLIAPRVRVAGTINEAPALEGVAEIWLRNEREQMESLLSDEFLQGARRDEPNWAAFWQTFVHESRSEVSWGKPAEADEFFKVYLFLKRRNGTGLEAFRQALRTTVTDLAHGLPALARRTLAPARDDFYGFGEPRFDALDVLAFASQRTYQAALASATWTEYVTALSSLVEPQCLFGYTGRDHWIIRPGER